MSKITTRDIILYIFDEEKGIGTGYVRYTDIATHNECIDVYVDGKRVSQYQTNDDEMLSYIIQKVENILDDLDKLKLYVDIL
jgi:type IV secretory pathway VirJ component